MAEFGFTIKGFYFIKMNLEEAIKCGFDVIDSLTNQSEGSMCEYCNKMLDESSEFYYITILNKLLCGDCFYLWHKNPIPYNKKVDAKEHKKQIKNHLKIAKLLGYENGK